MTGTRTGYLHPVLAHARRLEMRTSEPDLADVCLIVLAQNLERLLEFRHHFLLQ